MAQAVEVDVGSAVDGDEELAVDPLALDVALQARHAERSGRLRDGPGVLVDVPDRRASLVGGHQEHLVHVVPGEAKRLLPHPPHRHAVREQPHLVEAHGMSRAKRRVHRGRLLGLDADDPHLGPQRLHKGGDPADETSTADRDEDRVRCLGDLAQDLHRHRSLPRDDVRIVEGMDVHPAGPGRDIVGSGVRLVERKAVRGDLRSEPPHRVDLDRRCRLRHDDEGADAELPRRERHPLRVVAGGRGGHPARRVRLVEANHLVVRAPHLEREHGLHVLALEQHPDAETLREQRHVGERGLADNLVDSRPQDAFEVTRGHGSYRHRKKGARMIRHLPARARRAPARPMRCEG